MGPDDWWMLLGLPEIKSPLLMEFEIEMKRLGALGCLLFEDLGYFQRMSPKRVTVQDFWRSYHQVQAIKSLFKPICEEPIPTPFDEEFEGYLENELC
jgi:hypothetical protein